MGQLQGCRTHRPVRPARHRRLAGPCERSASRSRPPAPPEDPALGKYAGAAPRRPAVQVPGKGEQASLKILLALNRRVDYAHIILVEEPESHLAFCRMNILITKILEKCPDRQGLATTHSSYVRNKLGLEQLVLLKATGGPHCRA